VHADFDASWRRAALAGDRQAVSRLAAEALAPLYRFSYYRVGCDRDLCEEVVQETLVRALADLVLYDPDRSSGDVFPWWAGLARNQIHRVLARQRAAASLESLWARMDEDLRRIFAGIEQSPFAAEVLQREETRELVGATMSQLPPRYREALEAKYLLGQSVREIAVVWNVSEKAIESQLSRARQAFRETFLALTRNLNLEVP
jgi:RNA polymerase sigma-70 factor (ECF subfamily)